MKTYQRGDRVIDRGNYTGIVQEVKLFDDGGIYYEVRIFDGSRLVGDAVRYPADLRDAQ